MLGVCCHWIETRVKPRSGKLEYFNSMNEKNLQLGRFQKGLYSNEQIKKTYVNNVSNLLKSLPKIRKSGIKLFRISSSLFPLSDQVDRELWDNDEIKVTLLKAGKFIKENDMRVSTHPGQFCVLSSDSDKVVDNAVKELSMHAWLFDQMKLDETPYYAINVHGGKKDRSSLLIDRIKSLPSNVRKRLTLENDELCYSVKDLMHVSKHTDVPIVFDSHHFVFNEGGLSMHAAHCMCCETWRGIKPLQHISNTDPALIKASFSQRRKHSDMIHYVPDVQLSALQRDEIDVEVEAKLKNISVFKMSKEFNVPL